MKKYLDYVNHIDGNEFLLVWVETTLQNYLSKNPSTTTEEVEHILDYLASDEAPKRISRMSYDQAKIAAEKWDNALQKKGEEIKEEDNDVETVLDFGDGFRIVKLVGENAYKREGYLMRNCVASYYGRSVEVYSLRDKDNMPHCTMEKDSQVKGKGNGDIHPKYVGYVVKFLEHIGMIVGDSEMRHLGYINIDKLKEELGKETRATLFNKKYLPKNQELIDKEGKTFSSLDLLDQIPLITEVRGKLRLNFDLNFFVKASVGFLIRKTSKIGSSGFNAKIGSSGNNAKIGSSGYNAQIGSSGYNAQIGSSGYYAQIGSSGNNAQIGSSGYYAQIGSSGNNAQIGSSGYYNAQIGSSGYNAKIGSSGYNAQIGSSGYNAQIGSSGNNAQIGSSGNNAKIGSSGDYAKIGSSGYNAQIGSSGDYAKIGSSGDDAQIGSSGYNAKIGSSGDYAKIGSSGCYAQIGSSGNNAQIDISGENSVAANIGYNGKIKGSIGTWITLAEYDYRGKPLYVKSAQIDGKKLKPDTWYTLKNKKFTNDE